MMLVLLLIPIVTAFYVHDLQDTAYVKTGDLMLGGLFPIYIYDRIKPCGSKLRTTQIMQYVESMVFAINEINERQDILPNASLGFAILDTCLKESTALAQTLRFLPGEMDNVDSLAHVPQICQVNGSDVSNQSAKMTDKTENYESEVMADLTQYNVVGIIGAMKSTCSIQVATIGAPFQMPQISFSSTSDALSNKAAYPYFMRLVPPDKFQVQAMVDFIRSFNWSYISVIHAEGVYGEYAFKNLKLLTELHGICIAYTGVVSDATTNEEYDDKVKNLMQNKKAKVVVVFTGPRSVQGLLEAVARTKSTERFIWIGSDAWAIRLSSIKNVDDLLLGAFTFRLHFAYVKKFHKYFKTLNPVNRVTNPWFKEYWSMHFNCQWGNGTNGDICNTSANVGADNGYKPLNTIAPVIDSVYTFALALDAVIRNKCHNMSGEQLKKCISGQRLLRAMHETRFSGHSGVVAFDKNGDMLGRYLIEQVQGVNGTIQQRSIGVWEATTENVDIINNSVKWYRRDYNVSQTSANAFKRFSPNASGEQFVWTEQTEVPESVCSKPCKENEFYLQKELHCCWECRACRNNEILINNRTGCLICPLNTWPDNSTIECLDIAPKYIKYTDPIGILLLVLALIGMTAVTATFFFFAKNNNNRLVKASSRELSYFMLFGIFFGYFVVVILLVPPRSDVCHMGQMGFSLGFVLVYAPLVTRTNRIYRIFEAGKKTKKRPRMISSGVQLFIASILVLIQVLLSVVLLSIYPTKAEQTMPVRSEKFAELSCSVSIEFLTAFLVYNLILIVLCTFYAFMTRKLPTNFNESRFITFCVYTTLVQWMAFIPSYFTTGRAYQKVILMSTALILNGSVALVFLYLPKIYALLWVSPEQINAYPTRSSRITPSVQSSSQSNQIHRISVREYVETNNQLAPPPVQ